MKVKLGIVAKENSLSFDKLADFINNKMRRYGIITHKGVYHINSKYCDQLLSDFNAANPQSPTKNE